MMFKKKNVMRRKPAALRKPLKRVANKRKPKTFAATAAERELTKRAKKVKKGDIQKVLKKESQILDTLRRVPILGSIIEDVQGLLKMLKAYWNGRYTQVPFYTIASIAGALLYLLTPVDAIPDFIPIIGFVDDLAVLRLCLKLASNDIARYKRWAARRS